MARRNYDPSEFTPSNIRNVCILAHVDHGKTSIADCLLSLNGLVNKRSVGTTKYMDDRADEQQRQITMKSSVVSLVDILVKGEGVAESIPIILNLVDTPGHIDFSSEVTSAVRICDGALIVVDVVEGVCAQTKVAMKQAYDEKLRMILIVNKLDRLLVELKQDAKMITQAVVRVIEDCNVYMSHIYHLDLSTNPDLDENACEKPGLMFNPETGNVIFASAIDGWGFTLRHIARMYLPLVNDEDEDSLTGKLWDFDCYVSSRNKQVKRGAIENNKLSVFVQLVTSMLYFVYSNLVVRQRLEVVDEIVKKLRLTTIPSHWLYKDGRTKLRCIMECWQPLAKTILLQTFLCLPAPSHMQHDRIHYLLNTERYLSFRNLNEKLASMTIALEKCSKEGPPLAYISKMLVVNKKIESTKVAPVVYPQPKDGEKKEGEDLKEETKVNVPIDENVNEDDSNYDVLAIIRIYSGVIHTGQELYLLTPAHDPMEFCLADDKETYANTHESVKKITVTGVHVLLGRERHSVVAMGAGYICGISGVSDLICHRGTLSVSLFNPPLRPQSFIEPIVSNIINPVDPRELPQLRQSLRLLQQSDSCVKVILNEAGEHMLVTAGEVHLQKCLEDLTNKFDKINFNVSNPIYPLRETIGQETDKFLSRVVNSPGRNFAIIIDIMVIIIPDEIIELIQTQYNVLKAIQDYQVPSAVDIRARHDRNNLREPKLKKFKIELSEAIVSRLKTRLRTTFSTYEKWNNITEDSIWKLGPTKDNVNLLLNCVPQYNSNIFMTPDECDNRILVENYVVNAFNMCCNAGPLCEEPLMNCAFVVKTLTVSDEVNQLLTVDAQQANGLTQQFKICFRDALLQQNVVLMEPILAADIQTDVKAMGKLYAEVHKRFGKIIDHLSLDEAQKNFTVKALIPAVESEGFAGKVRKISSGSANPTLAFSHYQIVDLQTPESDEEEDEKKEVVLRSQRLLRDVRRRKGLAVEDEQVVLRAEKQRTKKK